MDSVTFNDEHEITAKFDVPASDVQAGTTGTMTLTARASVVPPEFVKYLDDAQAATAADVVQTGLDRVATGEDLVGTNADAVATAADRVATNTDATATAADRVATGGDRTATGLDRDQTGLDRVATGQDAAATAADRVATDQDRTATNADATATAADRVATGQDATATAADRVATGNDALSTAADAGATATDRVATGEDAVATAADRVQTGLDLTATGDHRASANDSEVASLASENKAHQWAEETTDVEVQLGEFSAKHHKVKASGHRVNAENAAEASATSETNSANSAAASQASATDSANSEGNALAHELKAGQWAAEPEDSEVEVGLYSARHYATKAEKSAAGGMSYRGAWDASSNAYPTDPQQGWLYKVNVGGSVDTESYRMGDAIIYNGGNAALSSGWDKIDNTETVTAVAGKVGDVSLVKGDVGLGMVRNVSGYSQTEADSLLAVKVDDTDARLSDDRGWSAPTVTLTEAQGGDSTARRAWSPLRVFDAIGSWWAGSAAKAKLDGIATGAQVNPATTASRTNTSTTTVLQAKGMNDHRTSGDHDGRYDTKAQVTSKANTAQSNAETTAQNALNTHKSSTDHDNQYVKKPGDTMTGNLEMADNATQYGTGQFAIQYNAASKSLDFNFIGA